jgi:hypothetical protein
MQRVFASTDHKCGMGALMLLLQTSMLQRNAMNDDGTQQTATLLATIIVLVLIIGGVVLARALMHNVQVQNCLFSGQKNCVAPPTQER